MAIEVDVPGHEMVGDDVVNGDTFVDHPPIKGHKPRGIHEPGVLTGGPDLCRIVWYDENEEPCRAIIRVRPKA
ncbi:MAG: hypothetical protein A3J62_02895 [Candidatus Buchananbacteria bacterium RIFCSPHIGHO2_02_FULL_38_8]|uniref:Uncharacterized protein n=1 Tax=Candidatus Buchananbacteria bacterium RIFCSPHIGHO2_02_FULL_38_8 TaxID=1797538 RepID=A0A1G1Y6G7_9BACT|nr:MAG: hypothetical protein A3J62_02895 [Candidatus Buchananbacteria bacterium RIFCSPHIGHO2_02_FULL_38_8]